VKISPLRLYSTSMWKLYNTPVARRTGDYVVGVTEILMNAIFIIFALIIILTYGGEVAIYGNNSYLFPLLALLIINQAAGMLQVRKLNTILALEQEGRTEAAEEISATVCRTIKICSICLIVAQVIIFVYYMYV